MRDYFEAIHIQLIISVLPVYSIVSHLENYFDFALRLSRLKFCIRLLVVLSFRCFQDALQFLIRIVGCDTVTTSTGIILLPIAVPPRRDGSYFVNHCCTASAKASVQT